VIIDSFVKNRDSDYLKQENNYKTVASFAPFCLRISRGYSCLFFVLLFLLPACSHCGPDTYIRNDYDRAKIKKVAVFPFYNNTQATEAGKVVTAAFIAGLVEKGRYRVEFSGNIKSFLVSERIIVRTGIDLDTIKLMGKRLNIDAVVLGQVEEYVGSKETRRGVVPLVSIGSRMVDVDTGKILFMAHHRKTGNDYIKVLDFGKIRSVGELTKRVVGEIIETMP